MKIKEIAHNVKLAFSYSLVNFLFIDYTGNAITKNLISLMLLENHKWLVQWVSSSIALSFIQLVSLLNILAQLSLVHDII